MHASSLQRARAAKTDRGARAQTHTSTQGANQAAAAARLGQPTYFVGAVGSDSYAAPLRQALADAGVRLDHLTTVPGPSGTAVILLQDGGARACAREQLARRRRRPWRAVLTAFGQLMRAAQPLPSPARLPAHAFD